MAPPREGAVTEALPETSRGGRWRLLLGAALALGVVLGVEWTLGWVQVLAPWRALAPAVLAAALLLSALGYLARAARVHAYFKARTRGRFPLSLRLVLVNTFFNNLLPMRLGEASFPLLLRRDFAVPMVSALTALLWLRLMDLHTLVLAAILGIGPALLGPGWAGGAALLWLVLPWLAFRFQGALHPPSGGRWAGRVEEVLEGLPGDAGLFAVCWAWTLTAWAAKLVAFGWLLWAFTGAPPAAAVLGAIGGDLTSVLPVHGLAGLGSYEAGVVAGMMPLGVGLETAVTGALNLHLFVLAVTLLGGLLALLIGDRRDPG